MTLFILKMWLTILISTLVLNIVMFMVHYTGPKGIILTWIPGRTLLLIVSLLHKPELLETLRYTWAAGVVPVTFLLAFHAGVRVLEQKGRLPRFHCAKRQWVVIWLVALIIMAAVILLIGFVESVTLYVVLGTTAIVLNIINVKDAPQHLEQEHVQLTTEYVIGTNIIILSVLFAMNALLDGGYLVWAGIISNIPLLAVVLLLGSTCSVSPTAVKMTRQHIYMLSYQTWPNMAFVGILWATLALGNDIACFLASAGMLVMFGLQYYMIKMLL
jgi:hypothetical protein